MQGLEKQFLTVLRDPPPTEKIEIRVPGGNAALVSARSVTRVATDTVAEDSNVPAPVVSTPNSTGIAFSSQETITGFERASTLKPGLPESPRVTNARYACTRASLVSARLTVHGSVEQV